MRHDSELLFDILDCVERIQRHTLGVVDWHANELLQTWAIHHIQIIGEAVSRLSQELKDQHPEIPWNLIVGMRNILVHAYFGVDMERVRKTVETDLPKLKAKVQKIVNP